MNECMFECYRRLFNLLHLVLAALILGIFVTGMYAIRKFHKILVLRVLSLSTTTVCTGYTSATTASTTTTIATLTTTYCHHHQSTIRDEYNGDLLPFALR